MLTAMDFSLELRRAERVVLSFQDDTPTWVCLSSCFLFLFWAGAPVFAEGFKRETNKENPVLPF